jgi:NhaA family Na+:H+ antiporter
MPIFAFFNAGVSLQSITVYDVFHDSVSLGVILGLVIGKPLGILLFCFVACQLKISALSQGIKWRHMLGVAMLGGIGFTMSLFLCNLSLQGSSAEEFAKIGILWGSLISAGLGLLCCALNFLPAVGTKLASDSDGA